MARPKKIKEEMVESTEAEIKEAIEVVKER